MNKYQKRIITIFICNIIDAAATLFLYSTGLFVELNPIMRYFLQNPIIFIIVKIGVAAIILYRLWQANEEKLARIVINICWIEYLLIAIYYFINCLIYFLIF